MSDGSLGSDNSGRFRKVGQAEETHQNPSDRQQVWLLSRNRYEDNHKQVCAHLLKKSGLRALCALGVGGPLEQELILERVSGQAVRSLGAASCHGHVGRWGTEDISNFWGANEI